MKNKLQLQFVKNKLQTSITYYTKIAQIMSTTVLHSDKWSSHIYFEAVLLVSLSPATGPMIIPKHTDEVYTKLKLLINPHILIEELL